MTAKNDEIMRYRGEYLTLKMKLEHLTGHIASAIKFTSEWLSSIVRLRGNLHDLTDLEQKQLENSIQRLQDVEIWRHEAKEMRVELARLKELCEF